MKTIEVPKDAHVRGDVVETSGGVLGEIVMHGWDMEGSFGYFLRTTRSRDYTWAYHHRDLPVWKKQE